MCRADLRTSTPFYKWARTCGDDDIGIICLTFKLFGQAYSKAYEKCYASYTRGLEEELNAGQAGADGKVAASTAEPNETDSATPKAVLTNVDGISEEAGESAAATKTNVGESAGGLV